MSTCSCYKHGRRIPNAAAATVRMCVYTTIVYVTVLCVTSVHGTYLQDGF